MNFYPNAVNISIFFLSIAIFDILFREKILFEYLRMKDAVTIVHLVFLRNAAVVGGGIVI